MIVRAVLLLCCSSILGFASGTASWEMNTFADFVRGRFTGLSLSRDGRITLAPKLNSFFTSDQPSLWSVAQGSDNSLYVGTGHRGRVYRVLPNGNASVLWTSREPEIFAVAVGPDGSVYAGTSPDGKVYRIRNGQASEFFDPQSRYIWGLAFTTDGSLMVATGDQGKIFRVRPDGKGELYYDTGQSHITCLLPEPNGSLLAGTEPNGILYRISAKDKAFVLYDANLPEIRAVAIGTDGSIYAAALGGSVAQKTDAASAVQTSSATPTVTAPATTVTVTEEMQAGVEIKPKQAEPPKLTASVQPGATVYTAPQETIGSVEKSALYKINPDHTVETLWTSREENIYDVLLSSNMVLFSTDNNGRIYRLTPDRRTTLVLQTNEGETTRLLASGDSLVAATGSMGKLFRIGGGYAAAGVYESPVHDAGTVARWGQLSWRGERKGNARMVFRTRSGNSGRPDRTWSEWSAPLADPAGVNVSSPNARFVQWKAELDAAGGVDSPSLTSVMLTYLPQNNPPVVRSINVVTQLAPVNSSSRAPAPSASSTYSVTVTDSGEPAASTLTGTPAQTIARGITQQIQISWQADDQDGDRLTYALYFKGEDESQWKLLRGNFPESSFTVDGEIFADGKYLFRVIASDRPSNSGATARDAELSSSPVIFDNTPPVVSASVARRAGNRVEVAVNATDTSSGLRRAEYSLDATHWIPLEAADGVTDGQKESFAVNLENLAPGEHLLVIRAFDSSNNAGLTKVVIAP